MSVALVDEKVEVVSKDIDKPKILYVAPLKDFSGYAHAARDYVRALDLQGCNLVTRDLLYDGGSYERTSREQELADRNTQDIDIVIQQTTPNETERKEGAFNVNIFCWETDRIPELWVNHLNKMDLVIVPCDENIKAARKCGVIVPIEKVHFAADLDKYKKDVDPYVIPGADDRFKFLAICQYAKKKGVDPLLKAYLSEFTPEDNVVLILKVYINPNDGPQEKERIQTILQAMKAILRLKQYPPIQLIHEVIPDDGIARLYSSAHCYALPSRGEGWSIPHFDALGYGLPPIATNWAGPTEFITDECGWLVDYNMSPVCDMPHPHDFMYTAKDNWAEPHVCHLKEAMREAFEMWKMNDQFASADSAWSKRVEACKDRIKDFSYEKIGPQLNEVVMRYYKAWRQSNVH